METVCCRGGATCLALSKDETIISALKTERKQLPAAALCRLGLSQLSRLDELLARRERLANRYLRLNNKTCFSLPANPGTGRRWESFIIQLSNREKRLELQHFLNKSGIGAAPPIWYHLTTAQTETDKHAGKKPALNTLLEASLALPLYASLTDSEQKKIINRIHRWVERNG
jgi:perosamine synthetase